MRKKSANVPADVDYDFLSLAKPQPGNPDTSENVITRLKLALEREDGDGFVDSPANILKNMSSEELNALLKDLEWGLRAASTTSFQRFSDVFGDDAVDATTSVMLTRAASAVSRRSSLRSRDSQRSMQLSQRSLQLSRVLSQRSLQSLSSITPRSPSLTSEASPSIQKQPQW